MNNPKRSRPARRVNKKMVDGLKPEPAEYIVWDTDIHGFGVKVTPAGRKVYVLKYRTTAGRSRKPAIGTHGSITADEARKIAGKWKSAVTQGGDPSAEKRETRRAGLDSSTHFENVVDRFVERYAKPRQKTWRETRRLLLRNCAAWRGKPVGSIAAADAYDVLEDLIARGHEATARVTLAWLKTFFKWTAARGIAASPVEHVTLDIERRQRDRVYSDDEVKAVWAAAEGLEPQPGAFVKLTLLLGVRKSELAGMRRSEFDNPERPSLWTVPHARTKSRKSMTRERVYLVPLVDLVQRIIRTVPKRDEDLVFPGRKKGKPFWPGTDLMDDVREKSGVPDWTFHACRHSLASWLKDEGHSEYERGLVLNHSEASVTAGYSHGYPIALKRELLEKWTGHVAEIVKPGDVTLLK